MASTDTKAELQSLIEKLNADDLTDLLPQVRELVREAEKKRLKAEADVVVQQYAEVASRLCHLLVKSVVNCPDFEQRKQDIEKETENIMLSINALLGRTFADSPSSKAPAPPEATRKRAFDNSHSSKTKRTRMT
jgi:glycine cleavage system regulatory protein